MVSRFSERDTELFYDTEDALYRSFWDEEGSLHWGVFDDSTGDDFLQACANLNGLMAHMSGIGAESRVLDLGCGNGNTSIWLGGSFGCRVTGIDISSVRIGNAMGDLDKQPQDVGLRVGFEKASATDLPFGDGAFTHVWSQAIIYHVHDKAKALEEAYRVLGDGGVFVFDDLIKPKPDVSETARKYVYDRLLFDTDYSFQSYQDALRKAGFQIREARDISSHLGRSYDCLSRMADDKGREAGDQYRDLSFAYQQMVRAVDQGELGWGLYLCSK